MCKHKAEIHFVVGVFEQKNSLGVIATERRIFSMPWWFPLVKCSLFPLTVRFVIVGNARARRGHGSFSIPPFGALEDDPRP